MGLSPHEETFAVGNTQDRTAHGAIIEIPAAEDRVDFHHVDLPNILGTEWAFWLLILLIAAWSLVYD
jgi:hypothetical protein